MVFNRLDFEATPVIEDDRKVVEIKLSKRVHWPISYSIFMESNGENLGNVASGKLFLTSETTINIDKDLPADAVVTGTVLSGGIIGLFLVHDEGSFEV